MSAMRIEKLLEQYVECARAHRVESRSGDSAAANRAYDKLQEIERQVREAAPGEHLRALLDHPEPGVRLWAATHMLAQQSHQALEALERFAQSREDGFIAFEAGMVLREWRRNGRRLSL